MRPRSRSAVGTATRPRLRSRKNSSGVLVSGTEDVLDVGWRDAEVGSDVHKRLTRLPAVDHVLHTRRAVEEDRLTERALRIDLYDPALRDREDQLLRPAVRGIRDPLEVLDDYVGCLLYTSPSPRDGLLSRMP